MGYTSNVTFPLPTNTTIPFATSSNWNDTLNAYEMNNLWYDVTGGDKLRTDLETAMNGLAGGYSPETGKSGLLSNIDYKWGQSVGGAAKPAGSSYDDYLKSLSAMGTRRGDVGYLGGVYKGEDGQLYEKNLFGDDVAYTGTGGVDTGSQMGDMMGVGQLGLGLASYLDQSKTAKKQRELMDQQIANNRDIMKNRTGYQADIKSAFGPRL